MEFNNQYLEYSEYLKLGGKLEKMPFNLLEFESRKIVDRYTQGRLKELTNQEDETKICINTLINQLNFFKEKNGISSESSDGYSVSFISMLPDVQQKILHEIVVNNLSECKLDDGTPYLYCGVN